MSEEKEIDIYTVLRFFSTFIRKKRNIIIGIFMLAILLACLKHFNSSPQYSSKLSIVSNSLPFSMVNSLNYPLEKAINRNNDTLVSQWLGLPMQQIAMLNKIELSEVSVVSKSDQFTSSFNVELFAEDVSVFNVFEPSIITYLNNNEFVKERTNIKKANLTSFLTNIQGQIKRLDSIQQIVPVAMEGNGNKSVLSDYNLGSIYQQMINLKSKETEINELLMNIEEFRLISGFDLIENQKSLKQTIMMSILISFVITLLYAVVYTLNILVKKSVEKTEA